MMKDYKLEVSFAGLFFCFYVFLAIFNASEYFAYFSIVFGLFGLIFAWKMFENIDDQPEGDEKMTEISETIHDGSMVFLSRKYKTAFCFIVAFFVLILVFIGFLQGLWIGLCTAIAFAMGALSSLLAGFFGINAAASASVRATQAAYEGNQARVLDISFNGGSVTGISVVSLGLAGIGFLFLIFARGDSTYVINGFALGASSIALLSSIAGNLYSNAAESSYQQKTLIPADIARILGLVTNNIGNSLRGVGLSSEVFESYVGALVATIAIGATSTGIPQAFRFDFMALPLLVGMAGLLVTIACVRILPHFERIGAFQNSALISAGAMAIAALFAIKIMGLSSSLFFAMLFGCLAGLAGLWATELRKKYFAETEMPANKGATEQLIAQWSNALESSLSPIVIIAVTVLCAAKAAGLYGIALAAVGLLGTVGINLSINALGLLAENSKGIAKIAGLQPEACDMIENAKAPGRVDVVRDPGYMIIATALTALALFGAYAETTHLKEIDISNADALAGLFFGAIIPFLTASLTMKSMGRLIGRLSEEAAHLEGTKDTASHVDYGAVAAIKETLSPGFIVLAIPVLVGLAFGKQALGALILGCILMGVGLALFLANDGFWNHAKTSSSESGKGFNPLKEACVPAINVLIKAVAVVSLLLSALFP